MTTDHLGSTRVVTNSNGGVIARHDYLPFGTEIQAGSGGRTAAQGYNATDDTRQKFTSEERDAESNLDYFLARHCSSALGRFTTVDPGNVGARASDPQSWNAYSYVRNNPVNLIDPLGLYPGQPEYSIDGIPTSHDIFYKLVRAGIADRVETTENGETRTVDSKDYYTYEDATVNAPVTYADPLTGEQITDAEISHTTVIFRQSDFEHALFTTFHPWFIDRYVLRERDPGETKIAMIVPPGASARMALVRAVGLAGEAAAGISARKEAIRDLASGVAMRFPDALDRVSQVLTEVKNVSYQSYTTQLRDYVTWAQQNAYSVELWVRGGNAPTKLSGPLQALVNAGIVSLRQF